MKMLITAALLTLAACDDGAKGEAARANMRIDQLEERLAITEARASQAMTAVNRLTAPAPDKQD